MRADNGKGTTSHRAIQVRLCIAVLMVISLCMVLVPFLSQAGLASGPTPATDLRQFLESPTAVEGDGVHHLGFRLAPEGQYALTPDAPSVVSGASIPVSVDLSAELPPIGDQGAQGSCVAWASSYYYKTWSEERTETGAGYTWPIIDSRYQFSPSFVYNQINGGRDNGSTFPSAFTLMQNTGDVDIAEFPYYQSNYTNKPSANQLEEAKPYRIPSGWTSFWTRYTYGPYGTPNDLTNAKGWLASGKSLVFAIPVYKDFPDYGSNPSKAYYDYNGTSSLAGGHGVCICGYNDNVNPGGADADHRGGFLMANSWGPAWNNGGFVWLSYDFVKRYSLEAWMMNDSAPDTPSISSLSAGSGSVGSSIVVNGNDFGGLRRESRVTFNGTAAAQVTWANQQITAVVPAGATSGPVAVYDWDGTSSNTVAFTVNGSPAPPTVTSVSPNVGDTNTSVAVMVLGSGFVSGCQVKLVRAGYAEIVATGVQVSGSTSLTCSLSLTAAAAGSWDLQVVNPGGATATLPGGFTVNAPAPAPCGGGSASAVLSLGVLMGLLATGGLIPAFRKRR